jgi:TolB-like protein
MQAVRQERARPESASGRSRLSAQLSEQLSTRQLQVLELMARGQSNKEIAHSLGISPETARTHAAAILAKLGAHSRTEAATAYVRWSSRVEHTAEILQRPAIAVLPLVVSPGDRGARGEEGEALALAAAMTRELATLLSRWCWFPVIAHAATRDPRSLGDTSGEIGRRLGARFLVDGELLRGRGRWRLTVHLIDAGTGHCVWSERYQLAARRWFATQDEVCTAIAAAAYPRLIATVCAELPPTPEADPAAWQLAHRALSLQELRDRAANLRAEEGFAQAIARDKTLVLAHFGRGLAAYDAVLNQWEPASRARERLARAADRCLELAPRHPEGHYLYARRQQAAGHHGRAQDSLREAIGANPSFAPAYALLGQTLLLTGDEQEGLIRMQQACRLDPRSFVAGLAVAHFIRAEYDEATAAIEHAIAANPRYPFARALAAACAWWRGDPEGAKAHAEALRSLEDGFAPESFARTFGERVEAVARLAGGLEQARRCERAPPGPREPRSISAASAPTRTAPRPRPIAR